MYFSFTGRRISVFALIAAILTVAVFATFEIKRGLYGETGFALLFTRVLGMELNTIRYEQERNLLGTTYTSSSSARALAIPVLTYHAIITEQNTGEVSPESFEGHNVGIDMFKDQMFALKDAGWETITLEEFDRAMRGESDVPERSFLLTFDDGAKESFYPVDPILRALDYEAVTFILPEYSRGDGTYYYLSRSELLRATESGRWQIGSHGLDTHYFVPTDGNGTEGPALANRIWSAETGDLETQDAYEDRVRFDLTESKRMLEELTGNKIAAYAFPFGDFGQLSKNIDDADQFITRAAADVYTYTFYQWWPGEGYTYNYPHRGTSMMKRITVGRDWSGSDLVWRLTAGLPKSLPYFDEFDNDTGWLSTWGDVHTVNGELILSPHQNESGASAILDGTGQWTDYTVRLTGTSDNQTGVALHVRYRDNDTMAICNFGNGFAHIEQIVGGEQRVIKGNRSDAYAIPEGDFTIEATVSGRRMSCSMNGEVLVETEFLAPQLDRGGIGIKTWDRELEKSVFRVKALEIEPVKNPSTP